MCQSTCSRIVRSWVDPESGKRKWKTEDGAIWTDTNTFKGPGNYKIGRIEGGSMCLSYSVAIGPLIMGVGSN